MCWVKWTLVAAWLCVHALLWSLLPSAPKTRLPWLGGGIAFADDGQLLVNLGGDALRVYDTSTGQLTHDWPISDIPTTDSQGSGSACFAVPCSGRRALLYCCGSIDDVDGFLFDFDSRRRTPLPVRPAPITGLEPIQFTPDGQTVVYVVRTRRDVGEYLICIWNVATGRQQFVDIVGKPESFLVSPDGRSVAVMSNSNRRPCVNMIDLATGRSVGSNVFDAGAWGGLSIESVFSSDGRAFAATMNSMSPSPVVDGFTVWTAAGGWSRVDTPSWTCGFYWETCRRLIAWSMEGPRFSIDPETRETLALPSRPFLTDPGMVVNPGRYVMVAQGPSQNAFLLWFAKWLKPWRGTDDGYRDWHCFDRTGEELAVVPFAGCPAIVAPDGRCLAVSPPDNKTFDLYTLPPPVSRGIVPGMLTIEVALLIAWTAWRRRRMSRTRNHSSAAPFGLAL